jgi:hypothetical protein
MQLIFCMGVAMGDLPELIDNPRLASQASAIPAADPTPSTLAPLLTFRSLAAAH